MNCLTEAIGLALPGNGSTLATHAARKALFERGRPHRRRPGQAVLRRRRRLGAAARRSPPGPAFENAVALDVAMGGSTNTVLHLLAAAREAELDFGVADIDAISRRVPCLCQGRAEHAEVPHGGRAPGRRHPGDPRRAGPRPGCCTATCTRCTRPRWTAWLSDWDIRGGSAAAEAVELFHAAPGGVRTTEPFSTDQPLVHAGHRRGRRLHPRRRARLLRRRRAGDPATATSRPEGCVVKTAGVADGAAWRFRGPAKVFESQEAAVDGDPARSEVVAGDVVVIRYEGPRGGPGMQEMLYPTSFLKGRGLGQGVRADHRRAVLRRHLRPVDRARLARGGRRRADRAGRGRRRDRHRHPGPVDRAATCPTRCWTARRVAQEKRDRPYTPVDRERPVSAALRAYASMATSASDGAYRRVPGVGPRSHPRRLARRPGRRVAPSAPRRRRRSDRSYPRDTRKLRSSPRR